MSKAVDHAGKRFGMWTVLSYAGPTKSKRGGATWLCRCDCGVEKIVPASALAGGKSKSCGCSSILMMVEKTKTHGHTSGGFSPTYRSWHAARQRCQSPAHRAFPDYGGRGILFCERWTKFANFLVDMGERPAGKTLDRIDVNGNYEPGNCKWSTRKEQTANRRPLTKHSLVDALVSAARMVVAANDNQFAEARDATRTALDAFDEKRRAA